MAKKNNGARPLAESAIAMALAGIMWHVFAPMPGIGPYFKYMSASLIAIVGSRHGRHWSTMTAVGLNALVGLAYGPKELLDSLLLVTPIGLMLPTGGPDGDEAADDRREFGLLNTETDKSKAEASFRRHDTWSAGKWWAMILLSYALLYPARVWALATLMGAKVSDVVGSMAATSYHVFERFWALANISADTVVGAAVDWMRIILPVVGMGYGAMLYLVNRPAYFGGLAILKRTRVG
ncbi:MAG TPA: hypothetical protein PLK04_10130 [Bacillota bacterium]|nr:hypothetical protein [Bacillota bacterium]HOK71170.1 hypothetical protein [Bacillota bacterium]HOL52196.1 hypothetical protein [Bacillota bacterium]HOO30624.1 hypothetical protein [Bacillota bacterium]HPQ02107.1 hypothetical protein [Bacillota bacterium]